MWIPAFLLNTLCSAAYGAIVRHSSPNSLVGSTIELDYGIFHGLENHTTNIIYFRGVPYADPPIGNLRWRAPVSPPSSNLGHMNVTQFGNTCILATQSSVTPGTSEDCLTGNIYVPTDTTVNAKLPVLVWFHGGGFQIGSTHSAPPELIMNSTVNPMVFVSFEYRIGPLGFLGGAQVDNDGDLNAGLLDQRAALHWVQRYIGRFGGDKRKVTIWGESAGGASTMYHLIARHGNHENLFRAAMGDSPSINFMPDFNGNYITQLFEQYAEFANCGNQGNTTLHCLRVADSNILAMASSKVLAAHPTTLYAFAPYFDGTFITERPVEAFASGRFAHVPVLYGSNTEEGYGWSESISDPSANVSMPNANETTIFNFIRGQYDSFSEESVNHAFELYPLDSFNKSLKLQVQQMWGDARYICSAVMIAGYASRVNTAYHFHYDNPHTGSHHMFDLNAFYNPPTMANKDDLVLYETMREYFTSFVTTGRPSSRNGIEWMPVTSATGTPRILLKPNDLGMEEINGLLSARCNFWHSISGELQT